MGSKQFLKMNGKRFRLYIFQKKIEFYSRNGNQISKRPVGSKLFLKMNGKLLFVYFAQKIEFCSRGNGNQIPRRL